MTARQFMKGQSITPQTDCEALIGRVLNKMKPKFCQFNGLLCRRKIEDDERVQLLRTAPDKDAVQTRLAAYDKKRKAGKATDPRKKSMLLAYHQILRKIREECQATTRSSSSSSSTSHGGAAYAGGGGAAAVGDIFALPPMVSGGDISTLGMRMSSPSQQDVRKRAIQTILLASRLIPKPLNQDVLNKIYEDYGRGPHMASDSVYVNSYLKRVAPQPFANTHQASSHRSSSGYYGATASGGGGGGGGAMMHSSSRQESKKSAIRDVLKASPLIPKPLNQTVFQNLYRNTFSQLDMLPDPDIINTYRAGLLRRILQASSLITTPLNQKVFDEIYGKDIVEANIALSEQKYLIDSYVNHLWLEQNASSGGAVNGPGLGLTKTAIQAILKKKKDMTIDQKALTKTYQALKQITNHDEEFVRDLYSAILQNTKAHRHQRAV